MNENWTYEDYQSFFGAEGWGCKSCGQLSSNAWWQCSGDIYCTGCKRSMWAELRVRFTRVPNRAPGQAPATWTHDPSGQGMEYAAHTRREHATLTRRAAGLPCDCGERTCYECRRAAIEATAQRIRQREIDICTGMTGFDIAAHADRMAERYRFEAQTQLAIELLPTV